MCTDYIVLCVLVRSMWCHKTPLYASLFFILSPCMCQKLGYGSVPRWLCFVCLDYTLYVHVVCQKQNGKLQFSAQRAVSVYDVYSIQFN